ncbi:hypothetical protein PIB30_070466 [Stylosanthes scabra]|uniref:Uncharacterized protein n=1 Tax=Stylosanthes scabra TaxID=79078 RepID=A0ABU6TQ22_9FABA|nr:hypothetical protein [Stylosanthes scabra]
MAEDELPTFDGIGSGYGWSISAWQFWNSRGTPEAQRLAEVSRAFSELKIRDPSTIVFKDEEPEEKEVDLLADLDATVNHSENIEEQGRGAKGCAKRNEAEAGAAAFGGDINDVARSGAVLEKKRVEHLDQVGTDLDIRTRSSDRSIDRGSDTENNVLTTGSGEPQATNRHGVAALSSGRDLRRDCFRHAFPIAAKPPPLMAAVLPWNRGTESMAATQGERERRLEEKV